MVSRPSVSICNVEELFADEIGQHWSAASVVLNWPAAAGLRAPAVTVDVIAPAKPEMTLEQLRRAHMQAVHDVLTAALLGIEEAADATTPQRKVRPVIR
jgi:hypothetical protein